MNRRFVKIVTIIIAAVFILSLLTSIIVPFVYSAPEDYTFTLDEIRKRESELSKKASDVYDLKSHMENGDSIISSITDEITEASEEKTKEYEAFKERFRISCEYGNVSYLEMLFSSKGLSSFLDSLIVSREISEYDHGVYTAYAQKVDELSAAKEEEENFQKENTDYDESYERTMTKYKQSFSDAKEYFAAFTDNKEAYKKVKEEENGLRAELLSDVINVATNAKMDTVLSWPVESRDVVREFGEDEHIGIDISADFASPVYAAATGRVIFAKETKAYGNCIVIDHGGILTLYAHLSGIGAVEGQDVDEGYRIGIVGATGEFGKPYLHFETIVDNESKNPLSYISH